MDTSMDARFGREGAETCVRVSVSVSLMNDREGMGTCVRVSVSLS